jgi:protein-disulfide isomerase
VEDLVDSLATPLGAGDIGPIEPPEPMRPPSAARAQWVALGGFATIGVTAILLFSGGHGASVDLRSAWAAELPDTAVPKNREAPPSDTVFAVSVDGLPSIGREDAKVTLVVVTDYACVGCERARTLLWALRGSYGDDLRVVFKPRGQPGTIASAAGACAAAQQGEFDAYDRALWRAGIDKFRTLGLAIKLPDAHDDGCTTDVAGCREVTRVARDLGLDLSRFGSGVKRCDAVVRGHARELDRLRVEAPAFFVNGRFVDPWGIENIGTFQTLIDDELAHARRRIAAGATADRYYRQWVLDVGRTSR